VLTASTDYTWGIVNGGTRQNLISYTLDGTLTNVTRSASGNFTTPSITFSAPYTLTFNAVTQDLVDFQFKDSTGTDTIVPALVQIQIDDPTIVNVPPTGVWLDSGTKFQFYDVEWESSDVKPTNQTVYTVDAPSNQTVLDRVYNGNVVATDYLGLPVSGAKVTVALANGTTITATTGSNGSVALREIPIGTFTATIRYLGTTTSVSGNAATESTTQAKVLASYPTFGIIAALLVVGVAASLTVVRRRHHAQRRRSCRDSVRFADTAVAIVAILLAVIILGAAAFFVLSNDSNRSTSQSQTSTGGTTPSETSIGSVSTSTTSTISSSSLSPAMNPELYPKST
jgi:hypothetical protein